MNYFLEPLRFFFEETFQNVESTLNVFLDKIKNHLRKLGPLICILMYKFGCQTTNQPSNLSDEGRSAFRRILLEKEEEFLFNTILYFWSETLPYIWID